MQDNVDRRLLDAWAQSRRRQDEARRFLARQRLPLQGGDAKALDEIVSTLGDLERLRRAELDLFPRPTAS
jgi:hypothetical protein